MKRFVLCFVLFLFGGMSVQTYGQVFTNPIPPQINMPNQIWRNFRMAQIGNQVAADLVRSKQAGKTRATTPKKPTNAPKPAATGTTVYQKQFSFSRSANSPLAEKIIDAQKGDSGDAAKTRQLIDYMWKNYETSFADENQRLGMPFTDVVSAMTYYIVVNYLYANDIASLDSENSVAVYKQLAETMAKDAEFAKLQPADKQLFAELLITMTGMPVAVYGKNKDKNELKNLGRENLERIFGDKAKSLQITANGVEL